MNIQCISQTQHFYYAFYYLGNMFRLLYDHLQALLRYRSLLSNV